MNPFDDPVLGWYVIEMFLTNMLLNKIVKIIISQLLWKPRDNALYRAFSRSVEHSLERKEYLESQDRFRKWFFNKHTAWSIGRLSEIFTPRARDGYKLKLNQLYQTTLALQPTHVYKVPGQPFPPALALDELPDDLRAELDGTDSSDSEERDAILDEQNRQAAEDALLALPGVPGGGGGAPAGQNRPGRRGALMGLGGPPALDGGRAGSKQQPEQPEEDWLKMLEFPEELPMATHGGQGFGPLAALIGRAWLASARRRVMMAELAENWAQELEMDDICQECDRQEDPQVAAGLQGANAGLQLKVTVVGDIPALTIEFEETYSVPEFPFQDNAWRAFLERNESWATLCASCRAAKKGMAGLPASPTAGAAGRPAVPPPALSDSPGSQQETPSESSEDELDGVVVSKGKGAAAQEAVPAEWHAVQVSLTSRLQILHWAAMARKRVLRRPRIARMWEFNWSAHCRGRHHDSRRENEHIEDGRRGCCHTLQASSQEQGR